VTFIEFKDFIKSVVPSHVEVQSGEDDMIRVQDHTADAEAYVKYTEGLDFSLQGVRNGEKEQVKRFSFKNEAELMAVIVPVLLQCLDGERRI
jgi:hypothetical protein